MSLIDDSALYKVRDSLIKKNVCVMLYFRVILVFLIAMFMKQKCSLVFLFSQAVCEARLMNQYGDVILFLEKVYSSFQEILKIFKVMSDTIFCEYCS